MKVLRTCTNDQSLYTYKFNSPSLALDSKHFSQATLKQHLQYNPQASTHLIFQAVHKKMKLVNTRTQTTDLKHFSQPRLVIFLNPSLKHLSNTSLKQPQKCKRYNISTLRLSFTKNVYTKRLHMLASIVRNSVFPI